MKKIKLLISIVCMSILMACGSSGGGATTPATNSFKGKVIDGYVTGATVFLDLNNDGIMDPDEPSSVTVENGDYTLDLTDDEFMCAKYVPTIVSVPVGAMDSTEGEVLEAYTMSLLAVKEGVTLNVTPFTTMLVDIIHEKNPVLANLRCGDVIEPMVQDELNGAMNAATKQLVRNYNIPAERLFADYVAESDSETHQFAVDVVNAFKRGYAERLDLTNSGKTVLAYFYNKADGFTGYPSWYQYSATWYKYVNTTTIRILDSNFENGYVLQENGSAQLGFNIVPIETYFYIDQYRGEDKLPECTNSERRDYNYDSYLMTFIRSAESVEVNTLDECKSMSSNGAYTNEVISIGRHDGDVGLYLTIQTDGLTRYSDYPKDDVTNLFADLLTIPIVWDRNEPSTDIAIYDWGVTRTEIIDGNRVETERYKGLDSTRTTYFSDSTWLLECAIAPYTNDEYSAAACNH